MFSDTGYFTVQHVSFEEAAVSSLPSVAAVCRMQIRIQKNEPKVVLFQRFIRTKPTFQIYEHIKSQAVVLSAG